MDNMNFYTQIEMKTPPTENNHVITKEYLEQVLKDYKPDVDSEIIISDSDDNELILKKYLKFIGAAAIKKDLENEDTIIIDIKQSSEQQINLSTLQKTFEFFGNGVATEFTFEYNFGTRNIGYALYDADTGADVPVKLIRLNDNEAKIIADIPFENDKKFIITIYKLDKDITIYKEWGVRIDTADSNPATAVKYIETLDTPPDNFGEKPCLMKDGVVQYYLDPEDFYKKEDGSYSDITSGNDGDIMIEIPKMAFFITNVGAYTEIRVTNHPKAQILDSRYRYLGHTRDSDGDRDKLYIGAYQGSEISGKLRSLSNKTPLVMNTITQFRTKAQANGDGYTLTAFYNVMLLQVMYLIKYGHLNSQLVLGRGITTETTAIATGGTEQEGMYYGNQDTRTHIKFAGIEDWYGNVWDRFDGCCVDADYTLYTGTKNFSDTGAEADYKNQGKWLTAALSNAYMKQIHGDTEKGFLPIDSVAGSSTTYYCDCINYSVNTVGGFFGGRYGDVDRAGAFALGLSSPASFSAATTGARLMFL